MLNKLTRRQVLRALRRFRKLGKARFLSRCGFGDSKRWVLVHNGRAYPSKAILGTAAGLQPKQFSGGVAHLANHCKRMGVVLTKKCQVALVACSQAKDSVARAAKNLYCGSLFRKARRYAETHLDGWVILSAKHGLVDPDAQLAPYDQRLPSARSARADWTAAVAAQLTNTFGPEVSFVVLCGRDYADAARATDRDLITPFTGLPGIGAMQQWLLAHT